MSLTCTTNTLNIIKDYANNLLGYRLPLQKFLDAINLILKSTWQNFSSKFYQQSYEVIMGGSASPTFLYAGTCTNCNIGGTATFKTLGTSC